MIRKASLNDVNNIMDIIKLTVEEMKTYNNTQWDENYPKAKDFTKDVESGDLYVQDEDGEIKGFICVNYIEPIEYEGLGWGSNDKAMVIHRMAVNPNHRHQGVGTKLMNFAEQLALENNVVYLKTDTYSINTKMNSLFKKCGYNFVGEMSFLGKEKPFYCYDKLLKK
ncbi:GNAT family N-acetyltransferase [Terrisporobacter vanillatitrophus]|uniref:GNAT family N-acetyltransferase n=1 Tax=Terrisporobacter vanillatitrophus TaxID=3058402 RepID=UPI003365C9EE